MKVAIQGLGEIPVTIVLVLEKERPDLTYVICSEYSLKRVAKEAGYKVCNREVIEEAAADVGSRLKLVMCDPLDPKSVGKAVRKTLEEVEKMGWGELVINYTGGSAVVKTLLGATGAMLSLVKSNVRLVYAIKYGKNAPIIEDHTKSIQELLPESARRAIGLMRKFGIK